MTNSPLKSGFELYRRLKRSSAALTVFMAAFAIALMLTLVTASSQNVASDEPASESSDVAPTATNTPTPTATPTHTPTLTAVPTEVCESKSATRSTDADPWETTINKVIEDNPKLDTGLHIWLAACTTKDGSIAPDCPKHPGIGVITTGEVSHVISFLAKKGIEHQWYPGSKVVRAYDISITAVVALSRLPGVEDVVELRFIHPDDHRQPNNPGGVAIPVPFGSTAYSSGSTGSQAAKWHGADDWHKADYLGQGVKYSVNFIMLSMVSIHSVSLISGYTSNLQIQDVWT